MEKKLTSKEVSEILGQWVIHGKDYDNLMYTVTDLEKTVNQLTRATKKLTRKVDAQSEQIIKLEVYIERLEAEKRNCR